MARKLRSVQDRFVTGSDYETAGMLHPRVRYSTVILRSYIGKNSARMSNEFLDVYFDQYKNNIQKPYTISHERSCSLGDIVYGFCYCHIFIRL